MDNRRRHRRGRGRGRGLGERLSRMPGSAERLLLPESRTWGSFDNNPQFVCGGEAEIETGFDTQTGDFTITVALSNNNDGCADVWGELKSGQEVDGCFIECVSPVEGGNCSFAEVFSPDCDITGNGNPPPFVGFDVQYCA